MVGFGADGLRVDACGVGCFLDRELGATACGVEPAIPVVHGLYRVDSCSSASLLAQYPRRSDRPSRFGAAEAAILVGGWTAISAQV
jgi:hypothetical protein